MCCWAMRDHLGRPVTESSVQGRWQLVFFGFTHCQSVCPWALREGIILERLDQIAIVPGRSAPGR